MNHLTIDPVNRSFALCDAAASCTVHPALHRHDTSFMISTFDLTLLGSMVSVGGLALLRQGKWPHLDFGRLIGGNAGADLTAESLDAHERSTALAGTRWLTVGALTLFVAYAHGSDTGYLIGPWSDVMFHLAFVSSCWATTLYRINQTALRVQPTLRARTTQQGQSSR